MQIQQGSVSYHIAPEDRPYITFERVLNKGTRPRKEKRDEKGKVTRAAHPGEFKEDWVKHLISHRAPFDPYIWVTPEWVLRKVRTGCKPIGYGNLDKLPANYPREWREKVEACIAAVSGQADARRELEEMKAKMAGGQDAGESKAVVAEPEKRSGRQRQGLQEAPGAAG